MQANIAPPLLLRAMADQCDAVPDDSEAIERLFRYLKKSRPTLAEIRMSVCEFYAIEPNDLMGRNRRREISIARQIFYFLAYKYTHLTMPQIGRKFGHCDHTTVAHGIHQIEKYVVTRPLVRDDLDLLRLRICEKMLLRPVRVTPC